MPGVSSFAGPQAYSGDYSRTTETGPRPHEDRTFLDADDASGPQTSRHVVGHRVPTHFSTRSGRTPAYTRRNTADEIVMQHKAL
jgi:hypothetical protein